jgi:transcriptional regulator
MYQPPHFREERLDVLQNLIRSHPFAAMVTVGDDGLVANHFPFVIDPSQGPFGTLRAHMSRANTQWRDLDGSRDALVIFQGTDIYITPSWYPTKAETGKAVPTWNYAIVHVHGRPRAIHDPEWLMRHVGELTAQHEAGRAEPWSITDAPADFLEGMLKGIVGVEMEISRIEGKWKTSQNRPEIDRAGVVRGLTAQGDEQSLAMAEMVAR